jgi:branched-chain amino acid aminotransferase
MSLFSNWNGKIVEEEKIGISASNRSFRYGDGCFETMKVINGNLLLSDLHFQRLFSSLETLQFIIPAFFTAAYLNAQIEELIKVNGHHALARVRLVTYRGEGGLYDLEDKNVNFIIQSGVGKKDSNYFNETGFSIGIFTDGRITADLFSSIKSNNYLRYAMAAMRAKGNALDDCILINAFNRVADSTIANVFIVTNGIIKTPSLTEGCISGVMRKYLMNCFKKESLPFSETEISTEELLNASEVFLTNATYGIRWVKKVGDSNYNNSTSSFLHKKFIAPLFSTSTF